MNKVTTLGLCLYSFVQGTKPCSLLLLSMEELVTGLVIIQNPPDPTLQRRSLVVLLRLAGRSLLLLGEPPLCALRAYLCQDASGDERGELDRQPRLDALGCYSVVS